MSESINRTIPIATSLVHEIGKIMVIPMTTGRKDDQAPLPFKSASLTIFQWRTVIMQFLCFPIAARPLLSP